jgi:hypothetical protein
MDFFVCLLSVGMFSAMVAIQAGLSNKDMHHFIYTASYHRMSFARQLQKFSAVLMDPGSLSPQTLPTLVSQLLSGLFQICEMAVHGFMCHIQI